MRRARKISSALVGLALLTGLSACGTSGANGDAGDAGAGAGAASATDLPEAGTFADGSECAAQAQGPWAARTTDADLFAALRSGQAPVFLGEEAGLPFEISEYPTLQDYQDPSISTDLSRLLPAWESAGYQEGVDWHTGEVGHRAAITLVRFGDAEGAGRALTALAEDYCAKAYQSQVLPDRSGMLIVRTTAAVRTLFVVDEILVSVMSCDCYGDATRRTGLIEEWTEQFLAEAGEAGASSSTT